MKWTAEVEMKLRGPYFRNSRWKTWRAEKKRALDPKQENLLGFGFKNVENLDEPVKHILSEFSDTFSKTRDLEKVLPKLKQEVQPVMNQAKDGDVSDLPGDKAEGYILVMTIKLTVS